MLWYDDTLECSSWCRKLLGGVFKLHNVLCHADELLLQYRRPECILHLVDVKFEMGWGLESSCKINSCFHIAQFRKPDIYYTF